MNIQITEDTRTACGTRYFRATCNKTTAAVFISKTGVQVICMNAAHRVWRGMGKHFPSVADAVAGYRSAEMKAIIQAAAEVDAMPAERVTH